MKTPISGKNNRYKNLSIALGFLSFVIILFSSCDKKKNYEPPVVEVGTKTLTWKTLMDIIPDNSEPKDSVELAQRFIQDWIKEQLVIQKAELELKEERKNFDELIENYRKSLLTYAFEQEWLKQKLDTSISDSEIEKYYLDNQQNFELKNYIVKIKFCGISTEYDKRLPLLKKLFYSTDEADYTKWEEMCVELGASYYFNEDKWLIWDEFIKQVPLEVLDVEAFLKKNKSIEFEKGTTRYLIWVMDYQLSGSQSPLSFEHEKIKSLIINKRRYLLLDNMRNDLYQRAMENKEVKTYYEQEEK